MNSTAASGDDFDFRAMPTLAHIPAYHAQRSPTASAIQFANSDLNWRELHHISDKIASALLASRAVPGDRIAYIGKGSAQFFSLLFGVAKAGMVMTPIQWRLAFPEIAEILKDARPSLLFLAAHLSGVLNQIYENFPNLQVILTDGSLPDELDFVGWCSGHKPFRMDPPDPNDVAVQIYTSGTTGNAKGVMLTHRNLLESKWPALDSGMEWINWHTGDVNLFALPVAHIGGLSSAVLGFVCGVRTVVHGDFDPAAVLETIHAEGVTKICLVPTMLQYLLLNPRSREIDASRLRHIIYGAAPIAVELLREAKSVFDSGFCQQYGATETTGTIVYLPPEDHDIQGNARMRSAGKAMPGVELRIVDEKGRILPNGAIGEVETRSIANMVGYWDKPRETQATIDAEGWLKTGDAGRLDDDGYLYIEDRIKDMICSGAENVYPAEVEKVIFAHPGVREVAVFGVPDPRWGEAVKAVILPVEQGATTAAEIISYARERLAAFKVPKTVDFVSEMPKGPSGKILRRALREPYWLGHDRRVN